ncbi:uncharacterized protein LOC114828492 [Galendromus occidentalis]|uniref:Uncharacterized protein LOC114828492 n=1 Tax=Galendromus occidentalis TaxID=34638 RepID=A0AAJ7WIS8_9ACAR|nr:uncharacterized protein LOC114828492 [Galendromus occidentalis]
MAIYLRLLVFAIAISSLIGGAWAASYNLQCACTTDLCKAQNKTTCDKAAMCFTQYLKRRDGSDPITRGCITSRTSLLCENRRPAVANWPVLVCCKNQFCNEQLPALFVDLVGNVTMSPPVPVPSNAVPADKSPTETEDGTEEVEEEEEESRDEETNANYPSNKQDTNFESNKIYNNPRFLGTIKRPETKITVQHPADRGLTMFHAAILITALAFLFLLFLVGFIILRRQARLFNTPYMAPSSYSKEVHLSHHDHHTAPTRMPLPRGLPVQMARTAYDNKVLHRQP